MNTSVGGLRADGPLKVRPRWLAVALRALLHGRTTETPVTVGLDSAGTIVMVQLDETGPHVVLDPDPPPGTVLRADPDVVLGLAAGALTVEGVIAHGTLRGDPQQLAAVFASCAVSSTAARLDRLSSDWQRQ